MFREPGHSASSMTSFAAGLPNLPSCRSIELPIPPGRKCWPSQGRDAFTCEAAASSMTFLPPGCRAVVSAGPPMLAKSGCGCFRELGHRILHDFLAAVLPNLPSCRSIELPIPRAANVGQIRARMFREPGHSASSMTSFAAGLATLPSCRAVELPSINYAGQLMLAYKPHKMIQTT